MLREGREYAPRLRSTTCDIIYARSYIKKRSLSVEAVTTTANIIALQADSISLSDVSDLIMVNTYKA
jgi:hypothetical protein